MFVLGQVAKVGHKKKRSDVIEQLMNTEKAYMNKLNLIITVKVRSSDPTRTVMTNLTSRVSCDGVCCVRCVSCDGE
jgi:hypothetical protein